MSYSLLVLTVAFAAACSSSEDMIGNEGTGSESSNAPITILGTSGTGSVNTGASYGEYTAFINVPGKWSVATSKGLANVYPSVGEGPTTVVVQVGENWGATRENVLTLKTEEVGTRGNGDQTYNVAILQSSNPAMDSVSTVFSANKGAGYSYMPGGEYCDGALIQLFNLVTLDSIQRATGVRLISDVIYPQTSQEYVTADSEEGITKAVTVNVSAGMDFSSVKSKDQESSGSGSIGVGVGTSSEKKSKNKYALKRQKNTQFTREIQYMNVMDLVDKATTREEKMKLLSPGFYSVQETFAKDIAAAKGNTVRQYSICRKFLDEFGPCFISKSVMGTTLDYQISVDSTLLSDSLGISLALEASFQSKVNNKSSGGEATFHFGYSDASKELMSKTQATVKVRGGDVSKVCILVTGGTLDDYDVTAWQNSCRPTRAVMVDMSLVPIYVLIVDAEARAVLTNYFREKLK